MQSMVNCTQRMGNKWTTDLAPLKVSVLQIFCTYLHMQSKVNYTQRMGNKWTTDLAPLKVSVLLIFCTNLANAK
jgi:hypothetical protein